MKKDARTLLSSVREYVYLRRYEPVDEFVAGEHLNDCGAKEADADVASLSDCGTRDGE